MKSRWIEHRGNRVFYRDYSNLGFDVAALQAEMDAVVEAVCAEPPESVLALSDVRGTRGSPQAIAILQTVVKQTTPYVKRRAVIGVSPVQRALVDVINKVTGRAVMHVFDDPEQALDWLVQ
jgi:hypothetical protein